ncbi:hypothetical protein GeomeDRAFT_3258 [Geobacter metallireducens RCH3]|nr:hypothetical protein GeomeDRAFT_3258 [Geobacter metallireducens RCH3]
MGRNFLNHLLMILLRKLLKISRNLLHMKLCTKRFLIPDNRLHLHKVNHALKGIFCTNRQLNWHRVGLEAIANHGNPTKEVRPNTVHLINKSNTRNTILISLPPHGLRLGLNTTNRTKDSNRTVKHAQRTLNLNSKVNVARRINNIYAMIAPVTGRRSGSNSNSALLLLLHPVHRGSAFMHLTNLVSYASIIKNTLSRRRLTGVYVRHYPDISGFFQWYKSCHKILQLPILTLSKTTNGSAQKPCSPQPSGEYPHAS